MNSTIWVAGIVAGGALLTTVVNSLLLARSKRVDYNRQDLVAQRLVDRQDALTAQAKRDAQLLLEANERVALTAAVTNSKLDTIHTLVNSTLSTALQEGLNATIRELIWMRRATGSEPNAVDREAIAATEARITELRAVLLDRLHQTQVANEQIETTGRIETKIDELSLRGKPDPRDAGSGSPVS